MEKARASRQRRFSAAERSHFISLYGASGLTQAAFARRHGIMPHTLQQWIYRMAARPKPSASGAGGWREVPFASLLAPSWAAEVVLDSGMIVRLSSSAPTELVSVLIEKLRRSSC